MVYLGIALMTIEAAKVRHQFWCSSSFSKLTKFSFQVNKIFITIGFFKLCIDLKLEDVWKFWLCCIIYVFLKKRFVFKIRIVFKIRSINLSRMIIRERIIGKFVSETGSDSIDKMDKRNFCWKLSNSKIKLNGSDHYPEERHKRNAIDIYFSMIQSARWVHEGIWFFLRS